MLIALTTQSLQAAAPAPPGELRVDDVMNDAGTALMLSWDLSPDDQPEADPLRVSGYRLEREAETLPTSSQYVHWLRAWKWYSGIGLSSGEKKAIATLPAQTKEFVDQNCEPGEGYTYTLTAVGPNGELSTEQKSKQATTAVSWFNFDKTFLFAATLLICGGLILSTELARRGKPIYIRPIAGLQAIEEAVGRATEMGRPMLFIPGIQDLNEIQTVAGITVLSHVAQTAAQYDMALEVPTSRSLVMTAARDSVQAGCLNADRPDVYDPNKVYFVTDDQFSYVAHVCGRMLREKPAACFYIGQFYAESLLLAETGNSIGAIQIAGTAEASQLPFFVAACDYTLLGEEMFAASAYLSREPEQLGMLRGQDVAKLFAAVAILGGCYLRMLPAHWEFLQALLRKVIPF